MIGIQQKAPDFTETAVLGSGDFRELSLSEFAGHYVVLFFYPLDFTLVCPTEIMEFSRRADEFHQSNARIIGVSCDSPYSHRAWLQQLGELEYPLIADYQKRVATSFGVLLADGFPARATFIIDDKGVVQHVTCNNPNIGRSVSETLRVLQALQTHGQCPVEWRRGEKTL